MDRPQLLLDPSALLYNKIFLLPGQIADTILYFRPPFKPTRIDVLSRGRSCSSFFTLSTCLLSRAHQSSRRRWRRPLLQIAPLGVLSFLGRSGRPLRGTQHFRVRRKGEFLTAGSTASDDGPLLRVAPRTRPRRRPQGKAAGCRQRRRLAVSRCSRAPQ
jgi:hypothetical protein